GSALERPDEPFDEAANLAFRKRADKSVDRLSFVESDDRGNRLDAKLACDLRMFVDIHLDERDLAARVGDRLLERRRELLARPAPRRPEINQHRLARRGRQHVGAKRRRRDLFDRRGRLCLRRDRATDIRHKFISCPTRGRGLARVPLYFCGPRWRPKACYSTGGRSCPSATTSGSCPVARRNFTRSALARPVVRVLTSG